MLRIDEIYNNTFWPWFSKNLPGMRMFMCDPFGRSDPDSVKNYGSDDIHEYDYIFFFDQEPIHLNIHTATFDEVLERNKDFDLSKIGPGSDFHCLWDKNYQVGSICTSEKNSEFVESLCKKYKWRSYYYFFHGWAALDWYRGYDKTFLIESWQQRRPTRTFVAPNRIIAGERHHRLQMLYWIFKLQMHDNHISCPDICPAENISIYDAVKTLPYDDAESVFANAELPRNFSGETDHPMHSCWLSLFDESADSLLYLVTETVATGRRHHLTEKTFKPIALGMPFVLVSTAGSLEYLRSYGFQTFNEIWDESYDLELDDTVRIQKIANLLKHLHNLSDQQRLEIWQKAWPIIEHNWNHFYNGGFETILWKELNDMLWEIKSHRRQSS